MVRCRVSLRGTVQGVGFRPFVYRLAVSLGLSGWVRNTSDGVEIEVEGEPRCVADFLELLEKKKPPLARLISLDVNYLPPAGYRDFKILTSRTGDRSKIVVPVDVATCDECLREMDDPENRRYRYPFINCTNCGPRYTIIERLPYDRENTTMKFFKMCEQCEREYSDPADRRFHAQPNACPVCGPRVWLQKREKVVAEGEEALRLSLSLIREGEVVAIKGLGGFHLVCLAEEEASVKRLRRIKGREKKPFAVMFPDLEVLQRFCSPNDVEREYLVSKERPIVLLEGGGLAESVSCGLRTIGAFLPYTPLHHLILADLGRPIVATSANVSDEPIVKDNREAVERLSGRVDYFLMHDRSIARRCDDSVCFVVGGRRILVRRGRGFAPSPVVLDDTFDKPVLALGAHLKNTVAVGFDDTVYVSQHIGDLEDAETVEFFEETVEDLLELFGISPGVVVVDRHPLYYSRRFAFERFGHIPVVEVQHHIAHILSCACEAGLYDDFVGFALDGTGYGDDGSIWGCEVFLFHRGINRLFHLFPFKLAGGDRAIRECYRSAFSLLLFSGAGFPKSFVDRIGLKKLSLLDEMLKKGINVFTTTSAGRLFDGVASICGVGDVAHYEAQCAVEFENVACSCEGFYPFTVREPFVDWRPAIRKLVDDLERGVPVELISFKFHKGFAKALLDCALCVRDRWGIDRVLLSGGVFQNRLLLDLLLSMLEERGFRVYLNELVSINDGCISLGQAFYVRWRQRCA